MLHSCNGPPRLKRRRHGRSCKLRLRPHARLLKLRSSDRTRWSVSRLWLRKRFVPRLHMRSKRLWKKDRLGCRSGSSTRTRGVSSRQRISRRGEDTRRPY